MTDKLISVVTPCFNEEANVRELHSRIRDIFAGLPQYRYEHWFIDNASRDNTVGLLRQLASEHPNVRVIVNNRNFGHIRSPYYALLQARGDAVVVLASDLQDPPELIPEFVRLWETGFKVVLGVKDEADEAFPLFWLRQAYYRLLARLADVEVVRQATGFGLYDQAVLEHFRRLDDPYPYFRGLLAEFGFHSARVSYRQRRRKAGITSQSLFTLYDLAMLGVVNHSKVPLRLATMLGFITAGVSFLTGVGYFLYKLLFWNQFTLGIAPILVGFFFLSSIQLVFIGLVGEYIGAIYTHVRQHPLVVERERINC